jgi:hypothetical protein
MGPWIGYVLAAIVLAGVIWCAVGEMTSSRLNILIVIAGGLIGWVVGMLVTPVSVGEQTNFPEYGKALSTFVSGYLVAKIDKLFDLSVKDRADINGLLIGRLFMFVSAFALGALSTFVWRSYISVS